MISIDKLRAMFQELAAKPAKRSVFIYIDVILLMKWYFIMKFLYKINKIALKIFPNF